VVQDAPLLLTEENGLHALALDLVTQMRDPFRLTNQYNFSSDPRTRVSLFVYRLGLLPGDDEGDVAAVAEDSEGRTYNLLVERVAPLPGVPDVSQVIVRLPDSVVGLPRNLFLRITTHGPSSNRAFITILGN
jgi:hypothetical protein